MTGTLLMAAGTAVLQVLLMCLAGAWIVRRGWVNKDGLSTLSRLVINLFLPCLLMSKLAATFTLASIKALWLLPTMAAVYVGLGFLLGMVVRALTRPAEANRRVVVGGVAFPNSGYIPMTLVLALAGTVPAWSADPTIADRGIAYVSVYLFGLTTLLWGVGFPYMGGEKMGSLDWRKVFPPPILGLFIGAVIGATPLLRGALVGDAAQGAVILKAAGVLGQATIPCAMLVLGGNLARGPSKGAVDTPSLVGVTVARLLVMPWVGIGAMLLLDRLGWLPADPMFRLVLMLEAATPTATNLVVMCQVHGRGEEAMATSMFWTYLASVLTLTGYVSLYLWLVGAGGAAPVAAAIGAVAGGGG